ncbi:hypothetical protein [Pedobacter endophyticus]|uniref:Uncharacterized protein n=1 Tax=Pedobacter endophyticus TaxID=2789740 RepID=A0A7S9L0J2_9SPHI|nr:hypothetical protein [Pedobacter endophyticus]QPH40229.1 hypothetical protein IZT61_02820 [Pedobacter endophyticus]
MSLDRICGNKIFAFAEKENRENKIIRVVISSEVQRSREIFSTRFKDFSATVEMTVCSKHKVVFPAQAGILKLLALRFSIELGMTNGKDFSAALKMTVRFDNKVVFPAQAGILKHFALRFPIELGMTNGKDFSVKAVVIAKPGLCELKQSDLLNEIASSFLLAMTICLKTENSKLLTANCLKIPPFLST